MSNTFLSVLFAFASLSLAAQTRSSYVKELLEYQEELNKEFGDKKETPLTDEGLKEFEELDFFPIDHTYHIEAKFIKTENEKPFEMPTTTERKPIYVKYGEAHFTLHDKEIILNVYQNVTLVKRKGFKDHLFLPFRDHTNGFGSYGGGRFMDLVAPEGDLIIIDFNKAYNPYCAYNDRYSCPIPPEENSIGTEIRAGVMNYGEHH